VWTRASQSHLLYDAIVNLWLIGQLSSWIRSEGPLHMQLIRWCKVMTQLFTSGLPDWSIIDVDYSLWRRRPGLMSLSLPLSLQCLSLRHAHYICTSSDEWTPACVSHYVITSGFSVETNCIVVFLSQIVLWLWCLASEVISNNNRLL